MGLEDDLDVCLRARGTLIVLVTPEEARALDAVKAVCKRSQRQCISWALGDGFLAEVGSPGNLPAANDPLTALEQIERLAGDKVVVVLKDFHDCWVDNRVKRKLRSVAQHLMYTHK